MPHKYATPPPLTDESELARVMHVRARRRLLEGTWDEDLAARIDLQFGPEVAGVKGPQTKAHNLFRQIPDELAVLYNETPDVLNESDDDLSEFLGEDGQLDQAGLWRLMRQTQMFTLGLRETLVRVGWNSRRDRLAFRRVTPDCVQADSPMDDPGTPWMIQELRWYAGIAEDGAGLWCWEVFDIIDPENPKYDVYAFDSTGDWHRGQSVADKVGVENVAASREYPWRFSDDRPFLPYALYHAELPDSLWDTYKWAELVDGAYDMGVAATHFQHLLFRGSWSQKYAVNIEVVGAKTTANGTKKTPMDPTGLVHLKVNGEPGETAMVGEWGPPTDLLQYVKAMEAYQRMISNVAGIDGAHLMRESADAWSGAALTLSRDGKRESQRVYGPQFKPVDQELLGKAAAVHNLHKDTTWPESGYRVQYKTLPLAGQELKDMRDHHNEMIAAGRMSEAEAYAAEHPGMSLEKANKELARISTANAAVARARSLLNEPAKPVTPEEPPDA